MIHNFFAANCSQSTGPTCLTTFPEVSADKGTFQSGLSIAFGVLGSLAVITIILAAISIANAGGNPETISKARKSVIYALVGLMIAVSAEVIVLTGIGRIK